MRHGRFILFTVAVVIRILNIAAVQDIPASNEVLDRKDSEGQKGEHESKNGWRHVFAFTCRVRC